MLNVKLDPGAAYRCDNCSVWWGSQVGQRRKTRFLQQLPVRVARTLPWDEYRGWRGISQQARQCPQCRQLSGSLVYSVQ